MSRSSRARRSVSSATATAVSASRARRSASITSMLVARAGAEADVDDVHDLLRLVGGGARAGEAALGARDRLARGAHFRARLGQRAAPGWRATRRARPGARASVPAAGRCRRSARSPAAETASCSAARRTAPDKSIDGWKTASRDGSRSFELSRSTRSAAAARRRTASDRCAPAAAARDRSRRSSDVVPARERRRPPQACRAVPGTPARRRLHRTVGDEQHAERFLRAVDGELRRLDEPSSSRQLLLRAQRVQPAAGPALLELDARDRNAPSRVSRARTLRLDDAPPRDDRQVRVGGRQRGLPPHVGGAQLGDVRASSGLRAPRPRAPARRAAVGRRASRSADFCGVTVVPSNSTPRFSVVVVTLPLTCSRVADRACASSASARRMPAAAIAADGLFADRALDRLVERDALGRRRRLRERGSLSAAHGSTAIAEHAAKAAARSQPPQQPGTTAQPFSACVMRARRSLRCS